ncbi:MAG: PilZ domain-containing protein [Candidatus Ratteibacteria bacterium]|nr:PilZ domain-containing protein [Candidatus Ratteibacteria bacterium]
MIALSMEKDFSHDRRFFQRFNNKLNLKYRIIKSSSNTPFKETDSQHFSIFKNISEGGILFIAFQELPPGTVLNIDLELLDAENPINCLVKVVRTKKIEKDKTYEIGAAFLGFSVAEKARLLRYLKGEW